MFISGLIIGNIHTRTNLSRLLYSNGLVVMCKITGNKIIINGRTYNKPLFLMIIYICIFNKNCCKNYKIV